MSEKKSCDKFNTELAVALYPKATEVGMSGKYECILAFDINSAGANQLIQKYKEAQAELFPEGLPSNYAPSPLREGNKKTWTNNETGEVEIRKGFEDRIYVTTKSKNKPFLVDPSGKKPADPETLGHGSYVVANINAYRWGHSGKVGISFGLNTLQVSTQREELPGGGFVDPMSVFDSMEGDSSGGAVVSDEEADKLFG
jgi:hypothetical protein